MAWTRQGDLPLMLMILFVVKYTLLRADFKSVITELSIETLNLAKTILLRYLAIVQIVI